MVGFFLRPVRQLIGLMQFIPIIPDSVDQKGKSWFGQSKPKPSSAVVVASPALLPPTCLIPAEYPYTMNPSALIAICRNVQGYMKDASTELAAEQACGLRHPASSTHSRAEKNHI